MNKTAKILIIDDEQIILDSCTQILASSNYQVLTANNGTIGLNLLPEYQPDVVFVDLKMPGISGFEVLKSIREIDPTIVTIVITGFATVGSAVDAMKEGAFDFLPKPFTPEEMRVITRRGLEKRALVQETIALRKEREMMRDHFAAIVSHELKSPLGAVQQSLFALEQELSGIISDEQKNRLERCQSRMSDLMNLIRTWLRVMSSDIDQIRNNFKPLSIETIITNAVESIEVHATRKGIEIQVQIEPHLNPVYGDEGTLVEAVVNLLSNAVKYSHLDSKVYLSIEEKEASIFIHVKDTGVGILKEDLPYIFNDFYMGQNAPKDAKGSGLGLALTRRIIEAHDGSISVESEPGKGSIFTICLPISETINTLPSNKREEINI